MDVGRRGRGVGRVKKEWQRVQTCKRWSESDIWGVRQALMVGGGVTQRERGVRDRGRRYRERDRGRRYREKEAVRERKRKQ